jgi:hypothetical protein
VKIIFSGLFVFLFFSLSAQRFGNRSFHEKKWALFHPFAALKTKKIYKQCRVFYLEVKKANVLDTFESGGKLDAFRHVFFMAAFSQKIKAKKVRKLGEAHEKGNYIHFKKGIKEEGEIPDSLATVMDLYNNETGIRIGVENKKIDLPLLKERVLDEMRSGKALYFKRNTKGEYLQCNDKVIRLEDYEKKWFIPKCLIDTSR